MSEARSLIDQAVKGACDHRADPPVVTQIADKVHENHLSGEWS